MQIGEQDLVRLEPAILDRLRLLDLDDHLRLGEHGFRRGQNAGAGLFIGRVVGEDAGACAGLHQDLMAARGQLAHRTGHEPNPELITLDLCRNTDAHDALRFQERILYRGDCLKSGNDCWRFIQSNCVVLLQNIGGKLRNRRRKMKEIP